MVKKNKLYLLLPLIAIVLIFVNESFGDSIFSSPYGQNINKYSIYVHFQPEWNSYPGSILYDITNVWSGPNNSQSTELNYDFSYTPMVADYNSNQLEYQKQKSFVELKHGFSNCESSWKPPLYRYAVDSVRNRIEVLQGTQLNNDPYVSIYPNIPNDKYNLEKQQELVKQGYVQFIPICTSKNSTSYEFAVSINDKNTAFDVYFVPSEIELQNYFDDASFVFYDQKGCFTINHYSFSGICDNVGKNSGLLIIIPDNLELSLTKVKISLHEKLSG
ncbi:MAG TPA: hypothetical protein VLD64_03430 [Nitrosarchaeum sp.]|nr:hypothetical protein [Nitrosarchaeum sp.]